MQSSITYQARAQFATHPLCKRLLHLMDVKKTNLAFSADVTHAKTLLQLADQLGPEIALLKTHIDIIDDFTPELTEQLQLLADKHQFLIFEDRKFADIGHTVQLQYGGGIYRIADWAHVVNAHILPGPGIIKGLASVGNPKQRGLILLAEMSSQGHLMDKNYSDQALKMAEAHRDFVIGFVSQHRLSDDPGFLYFTPGIKFEEGGDALGQQYHTPESAIIEKGADVIIVGRDIINAKDPLARAKIYRERGWQAYLSCFI
ncbi:MAG: orotidine 5'-phosphate decarboxylase [Gammaproteobacteria bacterium RIFCSPHIGHO2_12_FULL_42_10]|nr:MAG: orotidine 5'-phosphate decarboxylase [Gammaproteobacteria bacterium RIFCSPHIGHO2_12_FULL_42_10]